MSDFNPALPKNITWRVGKNKGSDADKKPNRCTLFIPAESMGELVAHLLAMVDTNTNLTEGEIYNWNTRQKEVVPGYYISGKGIGDQGENWAKGEMALMKIEEGLSPKVANIQAKLAGNAPAPAVAPPAPPAPPMPAIPAPSGF